MKKSFLILLFGFLVQACTSPVDPAPADLIPPKKMVGLLVDIHIAESRIESLGIPYDTGSVYFRQQQEEIFKKHQVNKEKFYKSYDYYVANISELDKIYEKVIDSLTVKEVEAQQAPATPVSTTPGSTPAATQ